MWPFKLRLVSSKHCFIALPKRFIREKISASDQGVQVFKLEYLDDAQQNISYVSWNGSVSNSDDRIEIDETFANVNNLKNDQLVILKSGTDQPARDCLHCSVVTTSKDDYELLAGNADQVEALLIQKVRVITNNLLIPLWISGGSLKLTIKVVKTHPQNSSYVILTNRTELSILGSQESSSITGSLTSDTQISAKQTNAASNPSGFSSMLGMVKSYMNQSSETEPSRLCDSCPSSQYSSSDHEISHRPFRVVPVKDDVLDRRYLCSILINEEDLIMKADGILLATMTKILSCNEYSQPSDPSSEKEHSKASYFRSSSVFIELDNSCPPGSCQVPYNLRKKLGLTISSKINITASKILKLCAATSIEITPLDSSTITSQDICNSIISHMEDGMADKLMLVTKFALITLADSDYLLDGTSPSSTVPYICKDLLKDSNNVIINTPMLKRINTSYGLKLPLKTISDMDALNGFQSSELNMKNDDLLLMVDPIIKKQLQLKGNSLPLNYGPILLYGPKKSGKTFSINSISRSLRCSRDLIYTSIIQFKQLRGKRVDTFRKTLTKVLAESYYRQPSVIFFDDIDSVVGRDQRHMEEKGPENLYRKRMAATFIALLSQLEKNNTCFGNRVVIIATCSSLDNLDDQIMNIDRNYFTNLIEITPPNVEERTKILEDLINLHKNIKCLLNHDELTNISKRCDLFLPHDLKTLLERTIIKAASKDTLDYNTQNTIYISSDDLEQSLKGYVPTRLRSVTLQKKSGRRLDQIGGMKSAKDTLIATVLLPIKYPILFSKCPIKFQSSVLLYGPPGCGKTLIAEAIANEVSLNLICVRGPELLSKYIGASEAAVRDLFEKAEAAKPCIVFFDEFESIAPRRGHDSTGVTDRVVNQMLTMMDGFEELSKGIFILAATSRPEFIDPALLRPGRFDVHVYCGLPGELDRLEILNIVCSNIKMENDVDLTVLAKQTKYFSGADLKSLIYSAQLISLNERIGNTSLKDNDGKNTTTTTTTTTAAATTQEERNLVEIVVANRHLVAAIDDLGDSIVKNNSKYDIQFPQNFLSSATQTGVVSSRATLA